ncbi:hypothetical protein GCK32_017529, partial [Trichostrongylus colubriformis]
NFLFQAEQAIATESRITWHTFFCLSTEISVYVTYSSF